MEKQERVKAKFSQSTTEEAKYELLIALGKELGHLPDKEKTPQNIVRGCQSQMYLYSEYRDGFVYFSADSDALISAGLAGILIEAYSGEPPEAILKCPPTFIEELGIGASLTPSRANGLYSIHLHMKQRALQYLISS